MKTKSLLIIAISIFSLFTVDDIYACANQPPDADLIAEPYRVSVGVPVLFDATCSIDLGGGGGINGIVKFYWDFDNDGIYDLTETTSIIPDGKFDGKALYTFDTPGTKTVKLKVVDTDNAYDVTTIDIVVISAPVINRNETMPTGYGTIQAAIHAADSNDFIEVAPGTYEENIDFGTKNITLQSAIRSDLLNNLDVVGRTVIDAAGSDTAVTFAGDQTNACVLEGFTITGGVGTYYSGADNGGGILCRGSTSSYGSSPTIKRCIIRNNGSEDDAAGNGGGIFCGDYSSPKIINCVFAGNTTNSGGALECGYYSEAQVINCTFVSNRNKNNSESPDIDIWHYDEGHEVSFINCILKVDGGAPVNYDHSSFRNCNVRGTDGTDFWSSDYITDLGNNINGDPNFVNAGDLDGEDDIFGTRDDGLRLRPTSGCIDAGYGTDTPGTDIMDRAMVDNLKIAGSFTKDIGTYESPMVWFVKGDVSGGNDNGHDWDNAFDDLQEALNNTNLSYGDEIWVATGTYKPGTLRGDRFELVSNVELYGGFTGSETWREPRGFIAYETILSGDIDTSGSDDSFHVVYADDALNAILDGFTISGANSNVYGGGLYASGSFLEIRNCIVEDNQAVQGAGLYVHAGNNYIKLANSFIVDNVNAGTVARGAGANISGSFEIVNCVFTGNSSPTGAGLAIGSNYRYMDYRDDEITNCTFVKNSSTVASNFRGIARSDILVTNCIFWGNNTEGTHGISWGGYSSYLSYKNCCIQNSSSGDNWDSAIGNDNDGNIENDPKFVDPNTPAGDDDKWGSDDDGLRIKYDSYCVDAGDDEVAPARDILGLKRVDTQGLVTGSASFSDIGAYEFIDPVYHTSFETAQGFDDGSGSPIFEGGNGWAVSNEDGYDDYYVRLYDSKFHEDEDTSFPYQYLGIVGNYPDDAKVTWSTENYIKEKNIIRVSCIPSDGSYINIIDSTMDSSAQLVASIKFDEDVSNDGKIWVYNGVSYVDKEKEYDSIVEKCREFLAVSSYPDPAYYPELEDYSYENTWIEFEIHLNWGDQDYDVYWSYYDPTSEQYVVKEIVAEDVMFNSSYVYAKYTSVVFEQKYISGQNYDDFLINRFNISDQTSIGGVFGGQGAQSDICIEYPPVDTKDPFEGHCMIYGSAYYAYLGQYKIRICPTYLDVTKPESWETVAAGTMPKKNAVLGYWDTYASLSGKYYLKIEVYDDIGRCINAADDPQKLADGIVSADITINRATKTVYVPFTAIGRVSKKYNYQEKPDITVNWPGSFPFTFQRSYSDHLLGSVYPLFFGWTHNHDIKVIEDTRAVWEEDIVSGDPIMDSEGLGIGSVTLRQGLSSRKFFYDSKDGAEVIYESEDHQPDYIIREIAEAIDDSDADKPTFTVTYTHYASDGKTMTFEVEDQEVVLTGGVEFDDLYGAGEGLVDWMVYAGAQEQADRFGSTLEYKWNNEEIGHEDEMPMYITEISNNRNDAKLVLSYEAAGSSGDPFYLGFYSVPMCTKISLASDDKTYDIVYFDGSYQRWYGENKDQLYYKYSTDKYDTAYAWEHISEVGDMDFVLASMYSRPCYTWGFEVPDIPQCHDRFRYDIDGTLNEYRRFEAYVWFLWWPPNAGVDMGEKYEYKYNGQNLVAKTQYVTNGGGGDNKIYFRSLTWSDLWIDHNKDVLYKEELIKTNSEGLAIERKTLTFNTGFEPTSYYDWDSDIISIVKNLAGYIGGGGSIDYEYIYGDARFPTLTTEIIEHFDDNGDGFYDRSDRKKTLKYDNNANLIDQRVYPDAYENEYVLTEYEYHDTYNFPIKQTTWQGYCYDDEGSPVKVGQKVEKQWKYGAYDGTLGGIDGEEGDFLVVEKALLKDNTAPTADEYAETLYEYYPLTDVVGTTGQLECGQLKIKKIDRDGSNSSITFYEYDDNGYPCKEWQGATLTGTPPAPYGSPQKRYYYNSTGLLELEADHLGKVTMNIYYDGSECYESLPKEIRIYNDQDVMTNPGLGIGNAFEPDTYDADLIDEDTNPLVEDDELKPDWYETITEFSEYDYHGRWQDIVLSNGRGMSRYFKDGAEEPGAFYYDYSDDSAGSEGRLQDRHGRAIIESFSAIYDTTGSSHVPLCEISDSMDRVTHKYNYNWSEGDGPPSHPEDRFIAHYAYTNNASGKRTSEEIYRVDRIGFDEYEWVAIFDDPILQKETYYEYDNLDRLIKVTQDPDGDEGSEDPMITQYGYDALGNRIYVIDPEGNYIFTDYDNANRKVATYFAEEFSTDIDTTKSNADVKKEVEYYRDNEPETATSYDYDGNTLEYTEFEYDKRGRIDTVSQDIDLDSTTDADTTIEYSDNGSITGPDSESYHLKVTDAESQATYTRLSYHGKIEKVLYPSGDYEEYKFYDEYPYTYNSGSGIYEKNAKFGFNGLLEKKAVWDGPDPVDDKNYMTYKYDKFNKLTKVTYPDNGTMEYEYTVRFHGEYDRVAKIIDKRNSTDRPGDYDYSTYEFKYQEWTYDVLQYQRKDYDDNGTPENYEDDTEYEDYIVSYDYLANGKQKTLIEVTDVGGSSTLIYSVGYEYDLAGRLIGVEDTLADDDIASFEYDDNGNRSNLTYYLDGSDTGDVVAMDYDYDNDNHLIEIESSTTADNSATFNGYDFYGYIDGMGRLHSGQETIGITGPGLPIENHLHFEYDGLGQLTVAELTDGFSETLWEEYYTYYDDGNIKQKTASEIGTLNYGYNGDLMTKVNSGAQNVFWDLNGNLEDENGFNLYKWNLDGRLRKAEKGFVFINLKYDPMGNRVYKKSTDETPPEPDEVTERRYIVDIVGKLPTILCEVDPSDSSLKNSYIYADGQILTQLDEATSDRYFYLHDRLGSVRQVVDYVFNGSDYLANVVNCYSYTPFGEDLSTQCTETVYNPFKFTGQWYDSEIAWYYLRARMYNPALMRFTARDPIKGRYKEPLTLHKYLYCLNDSINLKDPSGKLSASDLVEPLVAGMAIHSAAIMIGVQSANEENLADSIKLLDVSLALEGSFMATFDRVTSSPYRLLNGMSAQESFMLTLSTVLAEHGALHLVDTEMFDVFNDYFKAGAEVSWGVFFSDMVGSMGSAEELALFIRDYLERLQDPGSGINQ